MINHSSLVLMSHTPSGLEGVPALTVDFSIFKNMSHIHVSYCPVGLVQMVDISL